MNDLEGDWTPSAWRSNVLTCSTYIKVKWFSCRPGLAQRVSRGIALLFHDRGTRRGWVVSSTPRPHFTLGKDPVTHFTGGWVGPRAGLDGRKSRPHRDAILDRPASSQSLYRLSYPAFHLHKQTKNLQTLSVVPTIWEYTDTYLSSFGCLEGVSSSLTYWHGDEFREHICWQGQPQHSHIPMVLLPVAVLMEEIPMLLYLDFNSRNLTVY